MIKLTKFTQEADSRHTPVATVTMELFDDLTLPELLLAMEQFAKACGYHFDGCSFECVPTEVSDEQRD